MITTTWFVIDGMTHLTIELGYVFLALGMTAQKSDSFMGFVWREYGKADARWAVRDPTVISLELLTVFLFGPLCLLQAYGCYTRASWRHLLQVLCFFVCLLLLFIFSLFFFTYKVIICVGELYGGWMTFCPEWVDGNPNLDGSSFELLWIYLVFMNGLWVYIPLILLFDSSVAIVQACSRSKIETLERSSLSPWSVPKWLYASIALVLVVYNILVPYILFSKEDGGAIVS